MTKAEVIAEIAKKTGIEKRDVTAVVENFMESVMDSMVQGENVYLRGFGSFVVRKRAQKTARNISKNTTIIIPEHNLPTFKASRLFAARFLAPAAPKGAAKKSAAKKKK